MANAAENRRVIERRQQGRHFRSPAGEKTNRASNPCRCAIQPAIFIRRMVIFDSMLYGAHL
jgi:hypothetical protein